MGDVNYEFVDSGECDVIYYPGVITQIEMPPKPNWNGVVADSNISLSFHTPTGFNWFKRLMWNLCFGIKWEKIDE